MVVDPGAAASGNAPTGTYWALRASNWQDTEPAVASVVTDIHAGAPRGVDMNAWPICRWLLSRNCANRSVGWVALAAATAVHFRH